MSFPSEGIFFGIDEEQFMSAVPSLATLQPAQAGPAQADLPLFREGVVTFEHPLSLSSGRMLGEWDVAYRMAGDARLPLVLVMGGISAGRRFWELSGKGGWWQDQFGPGRAGDSDRFCFLGIDFLGGNGESTGPANWQGPEAGFPEIDTSDQAYALKALLDHLGITRLHSIVAASYGGMVALQFAALYPDSLERALVLCAGHRPSPLASGWRHVQRQVLELGIAGGDPKNAVRIARSLAMCTYRSEREFQRRFAGTGSNRNSPAAYLDHCGTEFADRFNAFAYQCLSQSIDDHYVDPSRIDVHLDLVGFTSDQIVPPQQLIELRSMLPGDSSLRLLDSQYGHDAFLKERGAVSSVIRKHLEGCA